MIQVEERNGFVIKEKEEHEMGIFSECRYVVFHPNFEGTFIDDFRSITQAKDFCDKESADEWAEHIRSHSR
ncbi:hypothetical protein [Paenibacillus naphthalenovorans]|uniref:hypothetical protein n=1 Tax=Paenibacillus naphthalenovorans TaxID=162209 RepID=UPI003D2CECB4